MKCCVYTRSFAERPYMDFFIEHYIHLGFDKIIILKSDKMEYKYPIEYEKYVTMYQVPNLGDTIIERYDHLVLKSEYDWILCVDIDEFLLLNKKFKNIKNYIEEKTKLNPLINAFYFRWGMIEKYDIIPSKSFKNIIKDYKIFTNSHIKSMVKRTNVKSINHPHHSVLNNYQIMFENQMLTNNQPNNHKINNSTFEDDILIHLHTRSIHNLITKALYTVLPGKGVKSLSNFKNLINNFDINHTEDLLNKFIQYLGAKAKLPYAHSNNAVCYHFNSDNFSINDYKYDVINSKEEEDIVSKVLSEQNINEAKYYDFVNKLQQIIMNEKIFNK